MPRVIAFVQCLLALCAASTPAAAPLPPDFFEPTSIDHLRIRAESTNIVLTWPSDPSESFAVLSRSNATPEAPWIPLTNQLPASPNSKLTRFCDAGRSAGQQPSPPGASLADLYRVFVIPDFWFDLSGVVLSGGPKTPGEDFIPFYYGTKETGILKPAIELIIDRDIEANYSDDDDIQLVNFGTSRTPRWHCAAGFWFNHDRLINGTHTLELRTLLTLNNYVGPLSQYLSLTNRPVRVTTTNDITFAGFPQTINGDACTIVAQSAAPRVNWRIAIRDSKGRLLASKTGRTTSGDIRWTWNLRDTKGKLHDDLATDPYFAPQTTIWPLDDDAKGSQRLLNIFRDRDCYSWWYNRLGRDFVRKRPSPEEHKKKLLSRDDNPLESQVKARPLDLDLPP